MRRSPLLYSLVTLFALTALAVPGGAQSSGTGRRDAARDSIRALRAARSEQSRFEILRRNHLPWAWGGGSGPCDERIGRFCLTHDDGEGPDWVAPPEPREIRVARDRLIERLATSAAAIPGDRWVAGQRVRYLVEARRLSEAREAARQCRADGWWCAALEGFASHYAGASQQADSAFSDMLARMPARERDRWTDPSMVLDDDLQRIYRRLRPEERERFQRRFWSLADPFLSRPGNDIRSEHLARNLMDQLQDRAKSTDNLAWGSDLREILIRYGWPTGWERVRQTGLHQTDPSLVSHYANSEQQLLPPAALFTDTATIAAGRWDAKEPRARAGYTLPLADSTLRWVYPLDHQFAVFHRGDSAVVVAAYALPPDTIPVDVPIEVALAVTTSGASPDALQTLRTSGPLGAVSARVPPGPLLVSLELVAERVRRAARARVGLRPTAPPPGRLALSDLLLLRDGAGLPETLEAALDQARGSTRTRVGENLGVYWEVYGLDAVPGGELTLNLRLREARSGWLRRVGERVGVVREMEPVRMGWRETLQTGAFASRALLIQIPALRPGAYLIELTASGPGAEPLATTQEIEVVK